MLIWLIIVFHWIIMNLDLESTDVGIPLYENDGDFNSQCHRIPSNGPQ